MNIERNFDQRRLGAAKQTNDKQIQESEKLKTGTQTVRIREGYMEGEADQLHI